MLKSLPYLLAMLAVVPLMGLLATGSWRSAWAYSGLWLRAVAAVLVVAVSIALILLPIITPG
jgi:hypothetical protein